MARNPSVVILSIALALTGQRALAAELRDLHVLEDDTGTRVVLDLDGSASYKLFSLENPARLVLDLDGSRLATNYLGAAANGLIANVRTGKPTPDSLRVVFDLGKSVSSSAHLQQDGAVTHLIVELQPLGMPTRTVQFSPAKITSPIATYKVIDTQPDDLAAPELTMPRQTIATDNTHHTPVKTLADVIGPGQRELIIAIDAGHGGKDPGAHGPAGLKEKNITLAVARELAAQIDADPGIKAVLIRDSDYFVPLQDRYMKARAAQADLFISIHADASPNNSAIGASVYVLSTRGASSQAAHWLADQENAADLVGGVSLGEKDHNLAAVLLDLSQSATMRASDDIAVQVLTALKSVGKAHKPAVERANFVVLRSPDVPSMLIETGFITNAGEEKKLNDPDYRQRLATAIASGVRQYFTEQAPPGTLYAARRDGNQSVSQHVVSRGETLTLIAAQHGVAVDSLRLVNKKRNDSVRVGERLMIPQMAATP